MIQMCKQPKCFNVEEFDGPLVVRANNALSRLLLERVEDDEVKVVLQLLVGVVDAQLLE